MVVVPVMARPGTGEPTGGQLWGGLGGQVATAYFPLCPSTDHTGPSQTSGHLSTKGAQCCKEGVKLSAAPAGSKKNKIVLEEIVSGQFCP